MSEPKIKTLTRAQMAQAATGGLSAARDAGYSLREARDAGYSLREARAGVPLVERPYTRMLAAIRSGQRQHSQATWGPGTEVEANVCGTAMCTAGHLVNLAGSAGYALKDEHGWWLAAALIHEKAHPGWPCQNFGVIPQESHICVTAAGTFGVQLPSLRTALPIFRQVVARAIRIR